MLRPDNGSRLFCFLVLSISIAGMWHEKEVRETWTERHLRQQIQSIREGTVIGKTGVVEKLVNEQSD